MKLTKGQKVRLALFWLFAGGLTIAVFVFVIGGRLFEVRDIYYIEYYRQPVSGLQVGGAVRYQGIQVGRVDDIRFDPDEPSRVTVVLSLHEGTPIKADVEAQLAMVGITGIRQVELIGGSRHVETLEPGSHIPPGSSLFDNITGDTQSIIAKVEILLNNVNSLIGPENQQLFRRVLSNIDDTLAENKGSIAPLLEKASELLDQSQSSLSSIENFLFTAERFVEQAAETLSDWAALIDASELDTSFSMLSETMEDVNSLTARLKELAEKPEWDAILERADEITLDLSLADFAEISEEVTALLEQFSYSFARMDMTIIRSSRDILRSMEILNEILEDLNEFSRTISEDPSSLIRF